jgi:hypothetical protein
VTPLRGGLGVRAGPGRDIHRDLHRPRVDRIPRAGQQPAHRHRIQLSTRQPVVQRAVPAPEPLLLAQFHQRSDRPTGTQHRITQLEQRIGSSTDW